MRKPRRLIPLPPSIVDGIDKIAGPRRRTRFITELLEREIRRHEQLEALREATGCWDEAAHPELAEGAAAWVRQMRQESTERFERLDRLRDAE